MMSVRHTYMPAFVSLLLSAVVALMLSACVEQNDLCPDEPEVSEESEEILNIDLEILTPAGQRQTPAARTLVAGNADEDLITDVVVCLFRADDSGNPSQLLKVLRPYFFERDETQTSLYHASCATTLKSNINDKPFRIGILANGSHLVDLFEPRLLAGNKISYSDFRAMVCTELAASASELDTELTPRTPEAEGYKFVMWGMPHDVIRVSSEATIAVESCLMRDLARFDIRLGEDLARSGLFDFRSVYFYKPSSSIMHIPDPDKVAETIDETSHPYLYATSPALMPDNKRYYRWDYEESVYEGVFSAQCYVPEGEVVMKGVNGGVGKPRDINHTNRPALVIGGYYNGSSEMSYYRIDICNETGALVDILRNHLYDVTVRSVLGPGQPTPDEAYDNQNVLVVADITDWCRVDRDVMFSGSDWITVTRRVINLTGNAGSGTTFIINSSVPLDQWEFKLGEDGDFTKEPLIEDEHFVVTRPIQETGSRILVVTNHDIPYGGQPVTERLYVRIGGRVLFYITITQHPMQDTYWFLGEYFPGDRGPWQPVIRFPIGGLDPSLPHGSFISFLRWLFGGDFSGSIGQGDNISDSEYINAFFWNFITWFFTDEYGHIIGGTPDDWNEAWDNPMAVIIFDFYKWMLGEDYYREITGPSLEPYDPSHPTYSTVGPAMAIRFMEWYKIFDFIREIDGPQFEPYDPNKPDYSTVGPQMLAEFIKWMQTQELYNDLSGYNPNPDGQDEEQTARNSIDKLFEFVKWYLVMENITGDLGNDKDEQSDNDRPGQTKPIDMPGQYYPWFVSPDDIPTILERPVKKPYDP